VVKDIMQIKVENVFLADEALFLMGEKYKKYLKRLFTALIPFKKKLFVTIVGLTLLKDDELRLAYKAGVREIYVVFAYPPMSLSLIPGYLEQKVLDSLKKIHDNGMEIFASFGLGFDYDDKRIFERSVSFAHKIKCEMAEFFIATPFPMTSFWRRLNDERRLLHQDWELYNSANVVFSPKNMGVEELYTGYIQCWKEFYGQYSFEDFGRRFSRYWGMDKTKLRQIYNNKRKIKKQDTL
jgi:radical SAM superfamily enzyme YgiQ (UPF0313 family)